MEGGGEEGKQRALSYHEGTRAYGVTAHNFLDQLVH